LSAAVGAVEVRFGYASVGTAVVSSNVAIVAYLHSKDNEAITTNWSTELAWTVNLKISVAIYTEVGGYAIIICTIRALRDMRTVEGADTHSTR
jgi:uncharacterized membrane protein